MKQEPIRVLGGGLVGSLLAVMLRQRGFTVDLYEARPDPRGDEAAGGRSINLIVTERGIHALKSVDLWKTVQTITVPVYGRTMHDVEGEQAYQPYGKDRSECNYSVSRGGLNEMLLDAADRAGVTLHFSHRVSKLEVDAATVHFDVNGESVSVQGGILFGADGAGSPMRRDLLAALGEEADVAMLPHGYKELEFPPSDDDRLRPFSGVPSSPSALAASRRVSRL